MLLRQNKTTTKPPYDPEAYEVEEVKGVEITARRGKKTVGVFSTYMAISYMYTSMIIMQHFSYCTIMSICLFQSFMNKNFLLKSFMIH